MAPGSPAGTSHYSPDLAPDVWAQIDVHPPVVARQTLTRLPGL